MGMEDEMKLLPLIYEIPKNLRGKDGKPIRLKLLKALRNLKKPKKTN